LGGGPARGRPSRRREDPEAAVGRQAPDVEVEVADLIAQGREPQHRWRRPLPVGETLVLGRSSGTWAVPWDDHISRKHAEICWHDGLLRVNRLPSARNPIELRGREVENFELRPGERFLIGQTTFSLIDEHISLSADMPVPVEQRIYSSQELKKVSFRNADERIDVLNRLPDVISGTTNDADLMVELVNMLLAGIPQADEVALVSVEPAVEGSNPVRVLHWDRRRVSGNPFHPSARLILDAMSRRQSVLHVWGAAEDSKLPEYTISDNIDWAFCTPVRGKSVEGWAIYAAGHFTYGGLQTPALGDPTDLRDELKFAELTAAILSALLYARRLQRQQAALSQFFSPVVIRTLADSDPDKVLAPRQTEVTVLFCDLRGFSRQSEQHADDLMALLERVSKALRVMTGNILDQGGVVGDFQGDAAMGFWGWPLHQPDAVRRACFAALGIRELFEANARRPGHPLADFRIGIGIATGQAVAGRIGTADQGKVGVFGPVVNLASRLEGMTKILHAPILLDEATAVAARGQMPTTLGRFRRVVKVRPYGMESALTVTELLPPAAEHPELTDEHIALYEAAVDAFGQGKWPEAFSLLNRVPPEDLVKDFLTVHIAQHRRQCPAGWDGIIPLLSKS
jgi:adenylate cyclase